MVERVKKLLEIVDQADKKMLAVHVQAFEKNVKAYQGESTKANSDNLAASKKACDAEIDRLWIKYFPEEKSFKSLPEVRDYLDGKGWKLSRATIYNHEEAGHIRQNSDGRYTLKEVEQYIKRAGLQKKDGSGTGDDEDLSREKQLQETRKLSAQAEHWELRNKVVAGDLIDREQVGMEFAARAAVLKSDVKNFWRKSAQDIVSLVDGDLNKVPELIEYGLQISEEWMGRYSEEREFTAKAPAAVIGENFNTEEDIENDE